MYNFFDSEKFKNHLKKNGISQSFIADKLNLSRNIVNSWANGSKKPSEKNLTRLCKLLRVDPRYLKGEIEQPTEDAYIKSLFEELENVENSAGIALDLLISSLGLENIGTIWKTPPGKPLIADGIYQDIAYELLPLEKNETPPENAQRLYDVFAKSKKESKNDLFDALYHAGNDSFLVSEKDMEYLALELRDFVKMRLRSITDYNSISENRLYLETINKM